MAVLTSTDADASLAFAVACIDKHGGTCSDESFGFGGDKVERGDKVESVFADSVGKATPSVMMLPDGRKVSVLERYTSAGTLVVDVPPVAMDGDAGQYVQDGLVELIKRASLTCSIHIGTRRGIIVHRADRLARHLQHALRKIIEVSCATTAVFVLTVARTSNMDGALLSRGLVIAIPSRSTAAPMRTLDSTTVSLLDNMQNGARAHRALVTHLAARPSLARTLTETMQWASERGVLNASIVEAAALADHKAAMMRGSKDGDHLALNYFVSKLRECMQQTQPLH
jgi:DNA polymerase III delta prime subunit